MIIKIQAMADECKAGYGCYGDVIVECEEGRYSLQGETECTMCPAGSICPTTSDEPIECGPGEFSLAASTECKVCPKGYVCKIYNNSTQFIPCELGQYSLEGGSECLPTPPGYFSASPAQEPLECTDGYFTTSWNSSSCNLCPRGFQCEDKSKEPVICPDGTYSGIGAIQCTKCPQGWYCQGEGNISPQICPEDEPSCKPEGFIRSDPENSERRNLASCAGGQYTTDGTACIACPEGYRCSGGNSAPVRCTEGTHYSGASATSCTACGNGYICPTPRASDRYQCTAGTVKDSGNHYCRPCDISKECSNGISETNCPSNEYSPGGWSSCLSCPAGSECYTYSYVDCTDGFYNSAGASGTGGTCTACPAGSFCQNNVRTQCVPGTYMPFAGSMFCLECPVNSRCPSTGMTAYIECTHNSQWSTPGSTSCTSCELDHECFVGYSVPCPSNYYSAVGEFQCFPCPEGKRCSTASDRTIHNDCNTGEYSPLGAIHCATCPAGSMCPSTKMTRPIPCPRGTYRGSTGGTSCTDCSNGQYTDVEGSTACLTVPSGHYTLATRSVAIPCPRGTYPLANSQGCRPCTAGSMCGIAEGSAAPANAACPIGYYCEVNTGLTPDAVIQKPCPAGKYGTSEGAATEAAGCTACDAGYYCPGGIALPIPCPRGAYCAAGSTTPTLCAAGTYNKDKAKSVVGACTACTGGQYCPQGSPWPVDCPSGSHCDGSATVSKCAAGKYMPLNNQPDNGVAAAGDCLDCPKGYYCAEGSTNPTPCPVGTYKSTTGGTVVGDCTDCPETKACPFIAITDVNSAVSCAAGHYCPAKTQYPHDNKCPAGKTSDSTSLKLSSECPTCPAGYGCTEASNSFNNPPIICAAGYYCPAGSTSASATPCPAGTFSATTGLTQASECTQCTAGSYCSGGAVAITGICSAGHWCGAGSSTATQNPCPKGTFSASTGLKTQNECTVCPLGYICASTAMTAAVKCPAGTYGSKAGLTGESGSTCTQCTAGSFCAEGVTQPTACGKGKFSVAGAKDTGTPVCERCPDGKYCALDATPDTAVTTCAAGFICKSASTTVGVTEVPYHPAYSCPVGHWCAIGVSAGTACAAGTYNPVAGKTVIGDCLTVPAGFYTNTAGSSAYLSNECPAGYFCPAGSSNPYANACDAGKYRGITKAVAATDCAACPTGYYCGKATVTPIECPQGFYCVISTVDPVKCPKGYYGAAARLRQVEDCTICPQGRYCSQAGLSEPDGLCDPGYFCGEGTTTPAPPTRRRGLQTAGVCPAGGYCPQGSKNSFRCLPGTFNTQTGQDEASD